MGQPNFRQIKQSVSLLDVLGRYKVELRGTNQVRKEGHCPLPCHSTEGDRSFHASLLKGQWVWSCHSASCVQSRGGKKKGGDLIEFVGFMEKCGLRQAGELLDSWFGPFGGPSAAAPQVPAREVVPANEVNPPLRFQLKDIRHTHPYLTVRGFEEEECEYLGVGFFPGKGSMSGRVVFPIHNASGELIGYAGRLVDDSLVCEEAPRWKFPPEFKRGQVLYNLHRVTEDDWTEVVVVESFWGVLACVRAGIMNVVAIMSNYATDAQVRQLVGFEKVIVLFDGDEPGRKGAADLKSRLPNTEVKTLADGVQPDSTRPDSLRIFLGFPQEPEGALTLTSDALSLLEAAPA